MESYYWFRISFLESKKKRLEDELRTMTEKNSLSKDEVRTIGKEVMPNADVNIFADEG